MLKGRELVWWVRNGNSSEAPLTSEKAVSMTADRGVTDLRWLVRETGYVGAEAIAKALGALAVKTEQDQGNNEVDSEIRQTQQISTVAPPPVRPWTI